jgi:hypothetical protein
VSESSATRPLLFETPALLPKGLDQQRHALRAAHARGIVIGRRTQPPVARREKAPDLVSEPGKFFLRRNVDREHLLGPRAIPRDREDPLAHSIVHGIARAFEQRSTAQKDFESIQASIRVISPDQLRSDLARQSGSALGQR